MAEIGVWPGTLTSRIRFERGARRAHPTVRGRRVGRCGWGGFAYDVTLDVPFYEARHVTITFGRNSLSPHVHADGPTASPHRYDDRHLCMWFPDDPTAQQWRFADGLLDLLEATVNHLFREAWWRETGEWLGPEVAHGPIALEEAA